MHLIFILVSYQIRCYILTGKSSFYHAGCSILFLTCDKKKIDVHVACVETKN